MMPLAKCIKHNLLLRLIGDFVIDDKPVTATFPGMLKEHRQLSTSADDPSHRSILHFTPRDLTPAAQVSNIIPPSVFNTASISQQRLCIIFTVFGNRQSASNLSMEDDDQAMIDCLRDMAIHQHDPGRIGWFSLPREIRDKITLEYVFSKPSFLTQSPSATCYSFRRPTKRELC
jgi:hypothetical protein